MWNIRKVLLPGVISFLCIYVAFYFYEIRFSSNLLPENLLTNSNVIRIDVSNDYELKTPSSENIVKHRATLATNTSLNVVIHVGPHKTGSTLIQASLFYEYHNTPHLQADNYVIPQEEDLPGPFHGVKAMANLGYFLLNSSKTKNLGFGPSFQMFLERSRHEKKNIILSAEVFDRGDPYYLKSLIGHGFHSRIVLVYRRYYEWVVSSYGEKHKSFSAPFPDFTSYMKTESRESTTLRVMEVYSPAFDDIAVLNFHDERPLAEAFFCEGVINADQTCRAIKESVDSKVYNGGHSLEYLRLINLGKSQSIVTSDEKTTKLEKKIGHFVERKLHQTIENLLTICPGEDLLEVMFQRTMNEEKILYPELFNETELRESFDLFSQNKMKLCSFNLTAILEDPIWLEFLRTL